MHTPGRVPKNKQRVGNVDAAEAAVLRRARVRMHTCTLGSVMDEGSCP